MMFELKLKVKRCKGESTCIGCVGFGPAGACAEVLRVAKAQYLPDCRSDGGYTYKVKEVKPCPVSSS